MRFFHLMITKNAFNQYTPSLLSFYKQQENCSIITHRDIYYLQQLKHIQNEKIILAIGFCINHANGQTKNIPQNKDSKHSKK